MGLDLIRLGEIRDEILRIAREVELTGGTEEDLRQRVERALVERLWKPLGVPEPSYEHRVEAGTYARSYGRVDALYGLAIFEYKRPGALRTGERDEAVRRMVEVYIPGVLREGWARALVEGARRRGLSPRAFGIVIDGYGVVFVECSVEDERAAECRVDPPVGFHDLSSEAGADILRRIARAVSAAYRKKMDARILAADFGYTSLVAKRAVRTLYAKLAGPSEKTRALFEEWRRSASQAYPISGAELAKIAELYGLSGDVDGVKLFYAVQTYYSLILKLIAAEVAARFYDSAAAAYVKRLKEAAADADRLRGELRLLESGAVYAWYGVRNFLEGELFSWYLEEWDDEVYRAIKAVVERLDEYDVEAMTLDPSAARDVFKLLYEELVPRKEVRQKLGIYTTPDWLAELVLDQIGLTVENLMKMAKGGGGPFDLKVLDPGVGTGTFLSLVIQRLGEALRRLYGGNVPPEVAREALRRVTRNVVGFDIDALAVLTARTNHLLALAAAGLLEHKGGAVIEIPIYLANSVAAVEEREDRAMTSAGEVEVAKVDTSFGVLLIPMRPVRDGSIWSILDRLRKCLEAEADSPCISAAIQGLQPAEAEILSELYTKLLEVKQRGADSLWISIIKSHLLPELYRGQFDYIVGNPPWLAYRYIADPGYQAIVKQLIKAYGLVAEEHLMTHMEMATLFFVRATDLYLKGGGLIGFVMPRSIFSADQHDAFRRGATNVRFQILRIVDCGGVEPLFYVPACAVVARKGGGTTYPVDALVVEGRLPEEGHKVLPLSEALRRLTISEARLWLNQIGARSFLGYTKVNIKAKRSYYYDRFYQGATVVPQACWFVDVVDASHPDFVVVQTARRVKVRGKVEAEVGPLPVEREFIYGVLTSAEVLPFCHLPPNVAVLPIRPAGTGYQLFERQTAQQAGYQHLARWLEEAERVWEKARGAKAERTSIYEWLDYRRKLTSQSPTAKYRVVYLTSGTYLTACVVRNEPITMGTVELRGIVTGHTLYRYDTYDEDEAHYLVAVLNSRILDELIKPMQSRGQFGERHFVKKPLEFPIPRYDPGNPLHTKLSELGRKAYETTRQLLPQLLGELDYDRRLRERGALTPQEVARLRQRIREELGSLIDEIDEITARLLSSRPDRNVGLLAWL